jgi:hypothetical protein
MIVIIIKFNELTFIEFFLYDSTTLNLYLHYRNPYNKPKADTNITLLADENLNKGGALNTSLELSSPSFFCY